MGHSIRLKLAKHDVYHIDQPLQRDIPYMIIVKNDLVVCKNQSRKSSCVPVKSDQCHHYCLSKQDDRYIRAAPILFKKLYVAELVTLSHPTCSSLISAILICCQNLIKSL